MKAKTLFVFILLVFFVYQLKAQHITSKFIGFDAGTSLSTNKMLNEDLIRKETAPYYYEESPTNSIKSSIHNFYGDVKTEFLFWNNKLGVSTGISFANINSSIGKYKSSDADFFYFLLRQDNTNTEYLKIKNIIQNSNYIGIPIDFRIYPFKPRVFRLYFKIGADFNYLIQSKTNVEFVNNNMAKYEKDVIDKLDAQKSFYSSANASIGFRFGKDNRPSFSYEFCFPSFIFTSGVSSLVKPTSACGFQFNFQYPLKSKEK